VSLTYSAFDSRAKASPAVGHGQEVAVHGGHESGSVDFWIHDGWHLALAAEDSRRLHHCFNFLIPGEKTDVICVVY